MKTAVIFNSDDLLSKFSAAIIVNRYPNTVSYDLNGKDESETDAIVDTIVDEEYDKVFCTVKDSNPTPNAGSQGTAIITISNAGSNSSIMAVAVDIGDNTVYIGAGVSYGNVSTLVNNVVNSINSGTIVHGFSAVGDSSTVTVKAPLSVGAAANSYLLLVTESSDISSSITNFSNTSSGDDVVNFVSGELTSDQKSTLEAGVEDYVSLYSIDDYTTVYASWDEVYPNITAPLAVHYLGGYKVDQSEEKYVDVMKYMLENVLGDEGIHSFAIQRLIDPDGYAWKKVEQGIEKGIMINSDLKYLSLLTGEYAYNMRYKLVK